MPIKTPNLLPGEKGYISKKERTAKRKQSDRKAKVAKIKKDKLIGKIRAGSKAYRIGRVSITPRKDKRYPIWRYSKNIGEILVTPEKEAELTFKRLGGIGNFNIYSGCRFSTSVGN